MLLLFFYYCKGSNSCGSNCELVSGSTPHDCTPWSCINGCTTTCSIGCGNANCAGVCDKATCRSYCSGTCHCNCGESVCNDAVCKTSCRGGGTCGNDCHNSCHEATCESQCYSACASWVTYVTGGCSSSSCSATGRNYLY